MIDLPHSGGSVLTSTQVVRFDTSRAKAISFVKHVGLLARGLID